MQPKGLIVAVPLALAAALSLFIVSSDTASSLRIVVGVTLLLIAFVSTRLSLYLLVFSMRSEEHTSELQSQSNLVCRLLLEKKKKKTQMQSQLTTLSRRVLENTNPSSTLLLPYARARRDTRV